MKTPPKPGDLVVIRMTHGAPAARAIVRKVHNDFHQTMTVDVFIGAGTDTTRQRVPQADIIERLST